MRFFRFEDLTNQNVLNSAMAKSSTASFKSFLKDVQPILTIGYLLAIAIGMIFNYQKYNEFGINIFDYADVFDFLIAPFSDLNILLFVAFSMGLAYLLFRLDIWLGRRFPEGYAKSTMGMSRQSWFPAFREVSFLVIFMLYIYIIADKYGEYTSGVIENGKDIQVKMTDDSVVSGQFIGKTNNIIFLLRGSEVIAVPISAQVKEIRLK